jgi:uncharacterized protein YndB with AHSA1/START domain
LIDEVFGSTLQSRKDRRLHQQCFVERSLDGTYGFEGRYREVTPPERIVHTFEWDGMPGYVCIETVPFEDRGDGRTRVVSTSLFHVTEERDGIAPSAMACDTGLRVTSRAAMAQFA